MFYHLSGNVALKRGLVSAFVMLGRGQEVCMPKLPALNNLFKQYFLRVIIADMKVGKKVNRQNAWPANQIRFDDDGRGYIHDKGITTELDGVRIR